MLAGLVPIANPARRAAPAFWAAVAGLQRHPCSPIGRCPKPLILKMILSDSGREAGPVARDRSSAPARRPPPSQGRRHGSGAKKGLSISDCGLRRAQPMIAVIVISKAGVRKAWRELGPPMTDCLLVPSPARPDCAGGGEEECQGVRTRCTSRPPPRKQREREEEGAEVRDGASAAAMNCGRDAGLPIAIQIAMARHRLVSRPPDSGLLGDQLP